MSLPCGHSRRQGTEQAALAVVPENSGKALSDVGRSSISAGWLSSASQHALQYHRPSDSSIAPSCAASPHSAHLKSRSCSACVRSSNAAYDPQVAAMVISLDGGCGDSGGAEAGPSSTSRCPDDSSAGSDSSCVGSAEIGSSKT